MGYLTVAWLAETRDYMFVRTKSIVEWGRLIVLVTMTGLGGSLVVRGQESVPWTPSGGEAAGWMQEPSHGSGGNYRSLDPAPHGWEASGLEGTNPNGYVVDPLLEKQLRFVPPEDEIEGIILESKDAGQEAMQLFCSERYSSYRTAETAMTYMPGSDSQFGWFSLESQPYLSRRKAAGITSAIDIHFLNGPGTVDLPARLFDFVLGYQVRASLSKRIAFDLAANVGIYSDFEDSARDGLRFPSHAVGMYRWNRNTDLVLGVDYLSRDDVKILPVFGVSYRSPNRPAWRFDLVFPRPRIDYMIDCSRRLYIAGLMGGGTWDIEFPDESDDVMTYRDFRLLFGYERIQSDGDRSGIELGYVFDRHLEFRNRPDELDFDGAFVLRWVQRQ